MIPCPPSPLVFALWFFFVFVAAEFNELIHHRGHSSLGLLADSSSVTGLIGFISHLQSSGLSAAAGHFSKPKKEIYIYKYFHFGFGFGFGFLALWPCQSLLSFISVCVSTAIFTLIIFVGRGLGVGFCVQHALMFNIRCVQRKGHSGGEEIPRGQKTPQNPHQTRPDSYANFQHYLYIKRRVKVPPRQLMNQGNTFLWR